MAPEPVLIYPEFLSSILLTYSLTLPIFSFSATINYSI